MNETPFVEARWKGSRNGTLIDLGVLHSTEGLENQTAAEDTAKYFARIERKASANVAVDPTGPVFCVHLKDAAYGAGGVNFRAYHIEQCGKAGQDAAGWADAASDAIITNTAKVAADVMKACPLIRPVWLTAADMLAGRFGGWTSHAEVEKYHHSTGHTDPGPNYPHALFLARAVAFMGGEGVTPEEYKYLKDSLDKANGLIVTVDGNAAARHADVVKRLDRIEAKIGTGGGTTAPAVADELARRLAQ